MNRKDNTQTTKSVYGSLLQLSQPEFSIVSTCQHDMSIKAFEHIGKHQIQCLFFSSLAGLNVLNELNIKQNIYENTFLLLLGSYYKPNTLE